MTNLQDLERLRRDTMEKAVIDSIPQELKDSMAQAQKKHEEAGGCPGCGSRVLAVHRADCSTLKDDFF